MKKSPSSATFGNILRWFDPRFRQPGSWAFILNRLTAIGLTVYLYLHLIMLGQLAQGPETWDAFIEFAKQPVVLFGEWIVVLGGLIHGLNGLRVILTSFGVGVPQQKAFFYVLFAIAILGGVIFAVRMFTA